jgi:hypothetical protein
MQSSLIFLSETQLELPGKSLVVDSFRLLHSGVAREVFQRWGSTVNSNLIIPASRCSEWVSNRCGLAATKRYLAKDWFRANLLRRVLPTAKSQGQTSFHLHFDSYLAPVRQLVYSCNLLHEMVHNSPSCSYTGRLYGVDVMLHIGSPPAAEGRSPPPA